MKIDGFTEDEIKVAQEIVFGKKSSDKEISDRTNISVSSIRQMKQMAHFKVLCMKLFDRRADMTRIERTDKVEKYLKPIYKELNRRLKKKDSLKNLPLKDLLRIMTVLHAEIRQESHFDKKFLVGDLDSGKKNKDDYDNSIGDARSHYLAERKSGKLVKVK